MWLISCSVLLVLRGTVWYCMVLYGTVFWGLLSWSHQSCQPKSDLWTYTTKSKMPAGPWFIIRWKSLRVSWKGQPFCGTKAKLWTKCIAMRKPTATVTVTNPFSSAANIAGQSSCTVCPHPALQLHIFSDVTSLQVELQHPALTLWNAEGLSRSFYLQMVFRLQKADLAGPFEERDRCSTCQELARNRFCRYSIIFWHAIQNELTQPWSSPSLTLCISYPARTHHLSHPWHRLREISPNSWCCHWSRAQAPPLPAINQVDLGHWEGLKGGLRWVQPRLNNQKNVCNVYIYTIHIIYKI